MTNTVRILTGMFFALCILSLCDATAQAQPKKGDKEVYLLTGNTYIGVGDQSGNASFSASGRLGYYFTRRNEVGGGIDFFVSHSKFCIPAFVEDGQVIIPERCDSFTNAGVGFSGFYRFNIAREGARGFPFIGADVSVADVTSHYTGNWRARPHVGYKYFLNKKVGLDFSFGYAVELNKVSDPIFNRGRQGYLLGQLGLTFLF
jgi:hypothetical protein